MEWALLLVSCRIITQRLKLRAAASTVFGTPVEKTIRLKIRRWEKIERDCLTNLLQLVVETPPKAVMETPTP
jgi:hypothetical protein